MCKLKLITGLFVASLWANSWGDVIDGEELMDPTRPLARPIVTDDDDDSFLDRFTGTLPSNFELSFVRASTNSPIAVINDRRVTIGDMIGSAEVVAIDRFGVTLLIDNEQTRLNLYSSNVKSVPRTQ